MKISVVGLGKLGSPLAVSAASKGFFVYGVDVNKNVVDDLSRGVTSIKEPGLQELIRKFKNNIHAGDDIEEAVLNSDITFVITPTPSKPDGYFSLEFVEAAIKGIAKTLRIKKQYHLIVVVSTVMPGSTDKIRKILEEKTNKNCGKDFGLCYNPEFIALGSVIYNLLNPDFILIGESDKKAGDLLQKFYNKFVDNRPKIARMNFVNAELTKIAVNTYVTTKISYANMLSEMCEKLPGGNVDTITSALGLDSRIGSKYLIGGPSFGGPCFPRDNVAFISLAKNLRVSSDIPDATHKTNVKQIKRITNKILDYYRKGMSIGILGLSYKPNTDVIENSQGMFLAQAFRERGIKLNLHDPLALENAKKIFDKDVKYFDDLGDCIKESDILVISTNWPEYKNIKREWFGNDPKNDPKIVIDIWRIMDLSAFPKDTTYIPIGQNLLEK